MNVDFPTPFAPTNAVNALSSSVCSLMQRKLVTVTDRAIIADGYGSRHVRFNCAHRTTRWEFVKDETFPLAASRVAATGCEAVARATTHDVQSQIVSGATNDATYSRGVV